MSNIGGSPIETSLLQTAQAQQVAGRAKAKQRAAADERAKRFADQVDLRVGGVESAEALRAVPKNDSEQAEAEHESRDLLWPHDADDDQPRIDLTA